MQRGAARERGHTARGCLVPTVTLHVVAGSATEPSGAESQQWAPHASRDGLHHLQDGFYSVQHLDEKFRKNEPLQVL